MTLPQQRLCACLITCVFIIIMSMIDAQGHAFNRVILDAGHGGKDKGAIWYGVNESHLNLAVARRVEQLLKASGVPVTMTRRSDRFLSLNKRAQIANRYRNAVFVSIHYNACLLKRVHGAESYYAGPAGRILAYEIQRRLVGQVGLKDRGIRKRPFAVLKRTKCPAVLIECGYISHTRERGKVSKVWHQKKVAKAIADGILKARR